ncbi:MAG TPA: ATP-dependent zinc metalloprotease FtsH [bacterium]|nr:ATP-dependent zinc metalloprotease FtsH [bacterium]HOM26450.1 ATP-dependent zinc metalloprotease FtsH [bacterium]
MEEKGKKNNLNFLKGFLFWVLVIIFIFALLKFSEVEGKKINLIYSDFINEVKKGNIEGVLSIKKNIVYGKLKDGRNFYTFIGEDPDLNRILIDNNISFKYEPGNWIAELIPYIIPALIFFFIFWMFIKQANIERNRVMSFARSTPIIPNPRNRVTFEDVAGCEEAKEELKEIIEFLKNPKKFQKLGGKIPKGVLLIGPPGTGKTLLAKAVAGEAGVPFLSMSGSDFVEMFVGVGAARVRDLFRQAKRLAPCIVFIDEIDAVGRQRFAGLGGGHDEREQTLNQLLVEMDGFQTDEGIIVMAATNRPDVLDPALTRPGRFDRTVVVTLPDVKAREKILKVHTKNKPLDSSVDLSLIARATPGLSGADLANIVNEAALLAAKKGKEKIDMSDFEEAKDKVLMGVERKSLYVSEEEKKIIAYHEAGHTLVQKSLPEVYPVHKVTIIPRGQALGITHILPDKDRFLESDTYYKNSLAALLAGRATEEIVFGRKFTGSENDLRVATEIAKKMVCEWGMSENLGPISFRPHEAVFLGRDLVQQREFSEETSREIDKEIKKILEEAEARAKEIIMKNRDKLDILVKELLEKETLTSEDIDKILGIEKGEENGHSENRKGDGTDNRSTG